jgi:hypothetical protein
MKMHASQIHNGSYYSKVCDHNAYLKRNGHGEIICLWENFSDENNAELEKAYEVMLIDKSDIGHRIGLLYKMYNVYGVSFWRAIHVDSQMIIESTSKKHTLRGLFIEEMLVQLPITLF